jgi:twinkle protein
MIYSARDLAKLLADRADSFCRYLLPNGQLISGNWCVGSPAGEPGSSTRIQITGPNAGVWADFADANQSGDLLGLIKANRNLSIKDAIKFAKDWLGITDPLSRIPEKHYTKPNKTDGRPFSATSPVESYLIEQRGLDGLTLLEYRIQESPKGEITFNFYSPDGQLENIKYLALQRDERGKKNIRQHGGCAPTLFGWQAINPEAREILITEGEIDAMTWFQMGFPAISMPSGCNNHEWIDHEWERLLQFDTIYLNYDGDAEGRKGCEIAAKRLGLHRCLIVKFPNHKDANQALQAGLSPCQFAEIIASARPLQPDQIKRPIDFRDRVIEKFYPPNDVPPGFAPQLFNEQYYARPGEVTVWTGISSHGKSALLSQLMLEAVINGYKVAIASMEMKGEQTLHRMICQAESCNRPSQEHIDQILTWLGGKLWIYDVLGNTASDILMELMQYSYARHGTSQFVIDSLMKTDIESDDYDGQRVFLNRLCTFSRETNSHIHLVAHARKGRDESSAPGKMDVKGSSDIINEPDNLFSVWRNKDKEQKVREHIMDHEEARRRPDTVVYCEKQRETGIEFREELRFMKGIFRFAKMHETVMQDLRITTRLTGAPPEPEPEQSQEVNLEANGEDQPEMFEHQTASLPYADT